MARVLKKYPNRRIYDTQTSSYITLADVRQMVINRERFQVVDSRTGNDLTRSVLLQIIADMEADGHESLLTNRVLEELIRFYGDKMVDVMGPFIEKQFIALLEQQDKIRSQFRNVSSGVAKSFRGGTKLPMDAFKNLPTPDKFVKEMSEQYRRFFQSFTPNKDDDKKSDEDKE